MAEPTSCCTAPGGYCKRVDTLFNQPGVHVTDVGRGEDQLSLTVETHPRLTGCPGCGVVAGSHGRRLRRLHDIPAFGAPVELVWRVRRYRCHEPLCKVGVFTEDHYLALPRSKLTTRAGVVGDQLHPTRHRLCRVGRPPTRCRLAHLVVSNPAAD